MYKRWEGFDRRRSLHHWLTVLKKAKTWQLIVVLVLLSFVSATFLRLNNLGMVELRSKVEAADKTGDAETIRHSLAQLQHYASAHMNAYPGVIYLQESYNRDYAKALETAASARNPNSDVYQQASIACRARFQGSVASFRNDYVACVMAEVGSLPPEQQTAVSLPSPGVYRYTFSSPLISFDFAGLGVITTFIVACLIAAKLTGVMVLRMILKRREKVV